jgi:hypothetical protein
MTVLYGIRTLTPRLSHSRIFYKYPAYSAATPTLSAPIDLARLYGSSSSPNTRGTRPGNFNMASAVELKWPAKKVRETFLKYFEDNGHTIG